MEKKYNLYRKLTLYFPVGIVLIFMIFMFAIIEITFHNYYKEEKENIKKEFYKHLKINTKQEVQSALKLLNNLYLLDIKKEKENLKNLLNILPKNVNFKKFKLKISSHPLKFEDNYIFVYRKIGNKYYYLFENKEYIKKEIKKNIPFLLGSFRWDKKNCLFVCDSKGVCYINGKNHHLKIEKKLIKAALSHPKGVYVKYFTYNSGKKISFVVYDKNLDLVIGSGVDINNLNKQLQYIEQKKQRLLLMLLNKLILFLVVTFLTIALAAYFLFKKIIKEFKKYDAKIQVLQKEKEKECFDELTQLLKRKCLKKEFEKHKNEQIAVIDIDINNFKNINELYGNFIGDEVIKVFGNKLKNILRGNDFIGKGKIDEFIIFLNYKEKSNIDKLAYRINETLTQTLKFKDIEISPCIRIGIAFNKIDGNDFDDLVNKASISAYDVKNKALKIAFYNKNLDEKIKKYMKIKNYLAIMIKEKNFDSLEVYYQPKVDRNENFVGMEALIRWNHSIKGLIFPVQFLPVAIKEGMIGDIDLITIQKVIIQIKKWLQKGYNPKSVSCNITMSELENEGFVENFEKLIKKYDFDTRYLEIEVTQENSVLDMDKIEKSLKRIKELGIKISLDNFGRGYFNFIKFKTLPIDKLKIDKTFIESIPERKDNIALTKIIIQTAKILNFKLVAQGVENKKQRDFVFKEGVDYIQGYYYSKPLPPQKIEEKYFKNK